MGNQTAILTMGGENLLQNAGSISHVQAIEKATQEYKKYQEITLSEAEKNYLESLRNCLNLIYWLSYDDFWLQLR